MTADVRLLALCALLLLAGATFGRLLPRGARENYRRRYRTLAALTLVVLGVAWSGGVTFALTIGVLAVLCAIELAALPRERTGTDAAWAMLGAAYLGVPLALLIVVRHDGGFGALVFLLVVVQLADVGAYLGGHRWGRHALVPALSPGKTWEGFVCGAVAAVLGALAFGAALPGRGPFELVAIGLLLAITALLGDLVASLIKRRHGVDDFGSLLPGHGGLVDRLDSYLAATPPFWWLLGGSSPVAALLPLAVASALGIAWMNRSVARGPSGR